MAKPRGHGRQLAAGGHGRRWRPLEKAAPAMVRGPATTRRQRTHARVSLASRASPAWSRATAASCRAAAGDGHDGDLAMRHGEERGMRGFEEDLTPSTTVQSAEAEEQLR